MNVDIGSVEWVVSLWIDSAQIQLNDRDGLPYLSWSPYDRVTIEKVEQFSDFFEPKDLTDWNGAVQRLHLTSIGECQWELGEKCLIDTKSSQSYGIYCIVTARFIKRLQNIMDIEFRITNKLKESIPDNVEWQAFHSLGTEGFVGFFLANNIANLVETVETIKQITYINDEYGNAERIFGSVYSFFGMNDPNFLQEPKANLLVRLHPKAEFTRKEVCKKLKEDFKSRFQGVEVVIREIISGKGYIEVEIPNHENIFSCFHNNQNAVFNGESNFYSTYIENSRTYWYLPKEKTFNINMDGCIGEVIAYSEHDFKPEKFDNIKIHPISRFILKEYERMINSHRCLWWKPILQRQYEVYAAFVRAYTNEHNEAALCTLNNKVQTVLLHINQATAPIYEVPYHNYYYSGSYNDVLRMYYGVIASIFNISYKLPRDDKTQQYNITYCVDFEAATKVHSSMYTMKDDNRRFVIFHLPYDAFMKFDKTIKLLLHEVFHYVAPYNRLNRNFIFVKEWIIIIFERYIGYLQIRGMGEENAKNLTEYFYEQYGEICKNTYDKCVNILNNKILNDFTTESELVKLQNIPETIFNIIYNCLKDDVGVFFKEVWDFTYKNAYQYMFGKVNGDYLLESIRRVSLAAKEAFCDLNMIYILDLSLNEYIALLYDMYYGQYNSSVVNEQLEDLFANKNISMSSFGLRIGMVIDQYYLNELGNAGPEKYKEAFIKEISSVEENHQNKNIVFCKCIERIYEQYLMVYREENSLFKEFFVDERQWFRGFQQEKYAQKKLRKAIREQKDISDNIATIFDFIDIEIGQIEAKDKKSSDIKFSKIKYEWEKKQTVACDIGDYVAKCCKVIENWNQKGEDNIVWFRGQCEASFPLLPSLFRRMNSELSLYANQAKYLQDAYYLTISESELWKEKLGSKIEHMCLLQHYGIPTSLLDFSDDMLIALHFALNPDVPDDIKKVDNFIYQPKVVLFNPHKYLTAIMSLEKGKPVEPSNDFSPFLTQEDDLSAYCVHDTSKSFLRKHTWEHTEDYTSNPGTNLYPQPIAIRRQNARIKAQKGTFLAYNLSANPEKVGKDDVQQYYSYLALESIQKDFLNLLETYNVREENKEFIKEIYINKIDIPAIKNQLKLMNITTAHVYPELYRLFAEYMDKIRAKE